MTTGYHHILSNESMPIYWAIGLKPLVAVVMAVGIAACQNEHTSVFPEDNFSPAAVLSDETIDAFLGEVPHDHEEQLAQQIAAIMAQTVREGYHSRGSAIRDAHPKAHGCVKALFHVDETLDASLAKGVFQPGRIYEAWLRFSNSSADPDQADITGDGRGMAIKLMGIEGRAGDLTIGTYISQDFIMISHPTFIMDDPSDYVAFQKEITGQKWLDKLAIPFTLGPKGAWNAYQITSKTIENPLQTRYWSMVPYRLGSGPKRQAIKFSAKPFADLGQSCPMVQDMIPSNPTKNYLREALRDRLAAGEACMQFLVQPRTASMSVENSKDEWNESDAPFHKVATIRIPQQEFDTPKQNLFCENLSFDPWHALPDHRPLGLINRLRRIIYPQISEVRHQLNSTPPAEPLGFKQDK
jgi:hypothetical protein